MSWRTRLASGKRPLPKRPFRDSAILYAVLAALLVPIALATGGSLVRAFIAGAIFFVAATAWSWWRWSVRLRREQSP